MMVGLNPWNREFGAQNELEPLGRRVERMRTERRAKNGSKYRTKCHPKTLGRPKLEKENAVLGGRTCVS